MKGEADIAAATGTQGTKASPSPHPARRGWGIALLALLYASALATILSIFVVPFLVVLGLLLLVSLLGWGWSLLFPELHRSSPTPKAQLAAMLGGAILIFGILALFGDARIGNWRPHPAGYLSAWFLLVGAFFHFRHLRRPTHSLAGAIMVLSLFGAAPAQARLGTAAFNQAAWSAADLVVIALPLESHDEPERKPMLVGHHVVSVETRFRVILVLKGDAFLTDFTLHHYRDGENSRVVNGPSLRKFDLEHGTSVGLLLAKEPGTGRYTPVGGQVDSVDSCIDALGWNWQPSFPKHWNWQAPFPDYRHGPISSYYGSF